MHSSTLFGFGTGTKDDQIPNIQSSVYGTMQSSTLLRIGTGTMVRPDNELFIALLYSALGLGLDRITNYTELHFTQIGLGLGLDRIPNYAELHFIRI